MNQKIIIGVVVAIVVLGGGFFFLSNRSSEKTTEDTTTQKIFVTTAPEPTEEVTEFEVGDFSISVLNGSGVAGLAGGVQSDLESADFVVDNTGNADNYDYKTTVVQAKGDVPEAFLDLLETELSATYGPFDREKLDDAEDVDVVIIIGGQQKETTVEEETDTETSTEKDTQTEATPTPEEETPTPTSTSTPTPTPAE